MELKKKIRRQEALFREVKDNLFSIRDELSRLFQQVGLNLNVSLWENPEGGIDYFSLYVWGEQGQEVGEVSLAPLLNEMLGGEGVFYILSGVRITQQQAEALKKLLA